jgi:hypothetical protein
MSLFLAGMKTPICSHRLPFLLYLSLAVCCKGGKMGEKEWTVGAIRRSQPLV